MAVFSKRLPNPVSLVLAGFLLYPYAMPVQRITRRKIKRARPQDRPQGRRFRAVLVNEFGRTTFESAGRVTREQARRETARLIYAAGLITPSADNPGGYTGSGGGRIPPNIPEN